MAEKDLSAASHMFIDELKLSSTGNIVVMLCMMWDVKATTGRLLSTDFVVSDAKGNVIHCTARATVAHNFLMLREGGIYSIKDFVVLANKEDYRVRKDDTFMLEFDGKTCKRKSLVISDGFIRYPLQLVDIEKIEPTRNKYLIDLNYYLPNVAGYVTNIGRMNHTKSGSKNIDFYLANHRGQSIRVTLWGGLCDVLIDKKMKHVVMCPIVMTSTTARHYNNKLCLSSSSSTMIMDDVDIPAIKELKSDSGYVGKRQAGPCVMDSIPKAGTRETLPLWSRNQKNDSATFHLKVTIDNIRTKNGWIFQSCGVDKCKKGSTRLEGSFWCDGCENPVAYPDIRYRLELCVSDHTDKTVFVLFDEPANRLVKCSTSSLLQLEHKSSDEQGTLSPTISNIIGKTHVFEIKSHTYYEYNNFESFICWAMNPNELVVDGNCSSAFVSQSVTLNPSLKASYQDPSIATPSKSAEIKKKNKGELEDSDVDVELVNAYEWLNEAGSGSAERKKKRKFIVEDSE